MMKTYKQIIIEASKVNPFIAGLVSASALFNTSNLQQPNADFSDNSQVIEYKGPADKVIKVVPHVLDWVLEYHMADGSIVTKAGGSLSWRCNNPGNLVVNNMESAKKIGAIGIWDGENNYAIFATPEDGRKALRDWWTKGDHLDETVYDHIERFAPSSENNVKAYRSILKQFQVPLDKKVKDLNKEERERLYQAIEQQEAFGKVGKTYHNNNLI